MSVYIIVAVSYRDREWIEAYRRDVPAMVSAHGGRYVARSLSPRRLEGHGPVPSTLAILAFPTEREAQALFAAPEYQPYLKARQAGAETEMFILDGLD